MFAKRQVSSKNIVTVDVMGDDYRIRPLSGELRNEFLINQGALDQVSSGDKRVALTVSVDFKNKALIYSVLNDDDTPMFTNADINAIRELDLTFATALFTAIIEASGFVDNEAEKKD